jgi:hypothetical protein
VVDVLFADRRPGQIVIEKGEAGAAVFASVFGQWGD